MNLTPKRDLIPQIYLTHIFPLPYEHTDVLYSALIVTQPIGLILQFRVHSVGYFGLRLASLEGNWEVFNYLFEERLSREIGDTQLIVYVQ